MAAPTTTIASKNIKQQQQNINQSKSEGVSRSTQGKTWAEVSF